VRAAITIAVVVRVVTVRMRRHHIAFEFFSSSNALSALSLYMHPVDGLLSNDSLLAESDIVRKESVDSPDIPLLVLLCCLLRTEALLGD